MRVFRKYKSKYTIKCLKIEVMNHLKATFNRKYVARPSDTFLFDFHDNISATNFPVNRSAINMEFKIEAATATPKTTSIKNDLYFAYKSRDTLSHLLFCHCQNHEETKSKTQR